MNLAKQEAHRQGDDEVEPSHLMLGLAKEGSGVAANVLRNLGVDISLEHMRRVLELPNTIGDPPARGEVPISTAAQPVFEVAHEESAHVMRQQYVGSEHLLMGLIRLRDATQFELGFDCTLEAVREATLDLLGMAMPEGDQDNGSDQPRPDMPPRAYPVTATGSAARDRTASLGDVFELYETAERIAANMGAAFVGTEHLLLAVARHPESRAARLLAAQDLSYDDLRRAAEQLPPAQ